MTRPAAAADAGGRAVALRPRHGPGEAPRAREELDNGGTSGGTGNAGNAGNGFIDPSIASADLLPDADDEILDRPLP